MRGAEFRATIRLLLEIEVLFSRAPEADYETRLQFIPAVCPNLFCNSHPGGFHSSGMGSG
ncbi:hypothetical protein SBA1_270007 [Candidatus Sulfotelmatobacter kueseliae]|uniref:Uncharacterized protein n=1 Tax=Candidatus Sulfotelmatobacter kueseliae TaxID=2042962 RepID=A0A2U3KI01_9BACT|nr:hypothetical protein SBA1_270007 [Candidatus Sulfotelmatobacter kueseliae]